MYTIPNTTTLGNATNIGAESTDDMPPLDGSVNDIVENGGSQSTRLGEGVGSKRYDLGDDVSKDYRGATSRTSPFNSVERTENSDWNGRSYGTTESDERRAYITDPVTGERRYETQEEVDARVEQLGQDRAENKRDDILNDFDSTRDERQGARDQIATHRDDMGTRLESLEAQVKEFEDAGIEVPEELVAEIEIVKTTIAELDSAIEELDGAIKKLDEAASNLAAARTPEEIDAASRNMKIAEQDAGLAYSKAYDVTNDYHTDLHAPVDGKSFGTTRNTQLITAIDQAYTNEATSVKGASEETLTSLSVAIKFEQNFQADIQAEIDALDEEDPEYKQKLNTLETLLSNSQERVAKLEADSSRIKDGLDKNTPKAQSDLLQEVQRDFSATYASDGKTNLDNYDTSENGAYALSLDTGDIDNDLEVFNSLATARVTEPKTTQLNPFDTNSEDRSQNLGGDDGITIPPGGAEVTFTVDLSRGDEKRTENDALGIGYFHEKDANFDVDGDGEDDIQVRLNGDRGEANDHNRKDEQVDNKYTFAYREKNEDGTWGEWKPVPEDNQIVYTTKVENKTDDPITIQPEYSGNRGNGRKREHVDGIQVTGGSIVVTPLAPEAAERDATENSNMLSQIGAFDLFTPELLGLEDNDDDDVPVEPIVTQAADSAGTVAVS